MIDHDRRPGNHAKMVAQMIEGALREAKIQERYSNNPYVQVAVQRLVEAHRAYCEGLSSIAPSRRA